jgi:hypothetical protein
MTPSVYEPRSIAATVTTPTSGSTVAQGTGRKDGVEHAFRASPSIAGIIGEDKIFKI